MKLTPGMIVEFRALEECGTISLIADLERVMEHFDWRDERHEEKLRALRRAMIGWDIPRTIKEKIAINLLRESMLADQCISA